MTAVEAEEELTSAVLALVTAPDGADLRDLGARVTQLRSLESRSDWTFPEAELAWACSPDAASGWSLPEQPARLRAWLARQETWAGNPERTWNDDERRSPLPVSRDAEPAAARFSVRGLLGRGGVGQVESVWDSRLERTIARKRLRSDRRSPQSEWRFLREARVVARLEHPNIVPVYDLIDDAGQPSLYLRAIHGRTLAEALRTGSLPDRMARLQVFQRVCEAIAYAHSKGVIHRDLKPDNVMLGEFGEVLVVDWGLARVDGAREDAAVTALPADPKLTVDGQIAGTPAYMAPEQARGDQAAIGERSDVYALGAILYELLADRRAFAGDDGLEIMARVIQGAFPPPVHPTERIPRELTVVISRAMALLPADRFPSVSALRADVAAFIAGNPLQSVAYTRSERLGRWSRSHRASILSSSVILGVALLTGVAGLLRYTAALDFERRSALLALRDSQLLQAITWHDSRPDEEARLLDAAEQTNRSLGIMDDDAVTLQRALLLRRSPPAWGRAPAPVAGPALQVTLSADGSEAMTIGRQGVLTRWSVDPAAALESRALGGPAGVGWVDGGWVVATWSEGQMRLARWDGTPLRDYPAELPGTPVYLTVLPTGAVDAMMPGADFPIVAFDADGAPHPAFVESGYLHRRFQSTRYLTGFRPGVDQSITWVFDESLSPVRSFPGNAVSMTDERAVYDHLSLTLEYFGEAEPRWTAPSLGLYGGIESADGQWLFARRLGGGRDVVSLDDGSVVQRLASGAVAELGAQAGPGGLYVQSDPDGGLTTWVPPRAQIPALTGPPRALVWSPDGSLIVAFEDSDPMRWIAPSSSSLLRTTPPPVPGAYCRSGAFTADAARMLVSCRTAGVWWLDVASGAWIRQDERFPVPSGTLIALGDDRFGVFDMQGGFHEERAAGGAVAPPIPFHRTSAWDAEYDAAFGVGISGSQGSEDRSVHIRSAGRERDVPIGDMAVGVAIDPVDGQLYAADALGDLWRWRDAGAEGTSFATRTQPCIGLDAYGGWIAAGCLGDGLRIWSADGRVLASTGTADQRGSTVSFSPDGKSLALLLGGRETVLDLGLALQLERDDAGRLGAGPDALLARARAWADRGGDPTELLRVAQSAGATLDPFEAVRLAADADAARAALTGHGILPAIVEVYAGAAQRPPSNAP